MLIWIDNLKLCNHIFSYYHDISVLNILSTHATLYWFRLSSVCNRLKFMFIQPEHLSSTCIQIVHEYIYSACHSVFILWVLYLKKKSLMCGIMCTHRKTNFPNNSKIEKKIFCNDMIHAQFNLKLTCNYFMLYWIIIVLWKLHI